MSRLLSTLSERLGKAINLPEVFFKPIPLSELLDTPISINRADPSNRPSARVQRAQARRHGQRNRSSSSKPVAEAAAAHHFVLEGEVSHGRTTRFSINGTDFALHPGTWVIGDLKLGVSARVKGRHMDKGHLEAASIVIMDVR